MLITHLDFLILYVESRESFVSQLTVHFKQKNILHSFDNLEEIQRVLQKFWIEGLEIANRYSILQEHVFEADRSNTSWNRLEPLSSSEPMPTFGIFLGMFRELALLYVISATVKALRTHNLIECVRCLHIGLLLLSSSQLDCLLDVAKFADCTSPFDSILSTMELADNVCTVKISLPYFKFIRMVYQRLHHLTLIIFNKVIKPHYHELKINFDLETPVRENRNKYVRIQLCTYVCTYVCKDDCTSVFIYIGVDSVPASNH